MKCRIYFLSGFFLIAVIARGQVNPGLLSAVSKHSKEEIDLAIRMGSKVDAPLDYQGNTALMLAVLQDDLEIARYLVEKHKADVNKVNEKDSETPLTRAVNRNNAEMVEYLVKKGAKLNYQFNGWTPLSRALYSLSDNHVAVVECILRNSSLKDALGGDNGGKYFFEAIRDNKLNTAKLLIEAGADVNYTDKGTGETSLMLTVDRSNIEMAKLLIAKKSDINAKTEKGYSPIIFAASAGNNEMIELLLKNGANLNDRDEMGNSPFLWAVKEGKIETVKYLHEKGVSVEDKNRMEETGLIIAAREDQEEVFNYLLEKGASIFVRSKDGEGFYYYDKDDYGWNIGRKYMRDKIKEMIQKPEKIPAKFTKI